MVERIDYKEKAMLEGLKRADPMQVKRLYTEYRPGVLAYIRKHGGTDADGRDIFQDLMIVLYRKVESGELKLSASLRTYLLAISRNLWRKKLRDSRDQRLDPEREEEVADLDVGTLERIEQQERDRIYFRHLDRLDEKCRQILQWFFGGKSMREIADLMDTTEAYIKKRKFMCKEKLLAGIREDVEYRELIDLN